MNILSSTLYTILKASVWLIDSEYRVFNMAHTILHLVLLLIYAKYSESVYFYHTDIYEGLEGLEINDVEWNNDNEDVTDDRQPSLSARYFDEITNKQRFMKDNDLTLIATSYDPISKEVLLVLGEPWFNREDQHGFVWLAKSKLCGKENDDIEILIHKMPMNGTIPGEYKATVSIGQPTSKDNAIRYLKQFAYYNSTIYFASRTFFYYEDRSKKIKIELRVIDPSCDDGTMSNNDYTILSCSKVLGMVREGVPSPIPANRQEFYDENPSFSYNSGEFVIANQNLKPEIDPENGEIMFFLQIYDDPLSKEIHLTKINTNGHRALLSVANQTDVIQDFQEVVAYHNGQLCWSQGNEISCGKLIEGNTLLIDEWKLFEIPDDMVEMCNIDMNGLTALNANTSGIGSILDRMLILNMTHKYADIVFSCSAHPESFRDVYYPVNRLRLDKLSGKRDIVRLETNKLHKNTAYSISVDFMVDEADLATCGSTSGNMYTSWALLCSLLVAYYT
ncbi:unnamed protein product [Owenia fusiformis]|uniref:Uncharacterized protein n=1 Tax=Owenia fusiformis TaxID=6347 RepID=A0A8J1V1I8_OWEFU|nr:unnamed protein product [Owenia fusiformis]